MRVRGIVLVLPDPDGLPRRLARPARRAVVEDVQRLRAAQEPAPLLQDRLERGVDPGVAERRVPGGSAHRPVQHSAEGQGDGLTAELRRNRQDLVDQPQELLGTTQVPPAVRPAGRDLVDHPVEVHPDDRVGPDQLGERHDRPVPQRLPAPGRRPLGVPGEPRLQVVLTVREPTRQTPDVDSTSTQRHARDPSPEPESLA